MSYIGSFVKRIYGLTADTTELGPALRASPSASTQMVPEVLPVATTSRKFKGPQRNGHFSVHIMCTEAGAGGSGVTVWYSNLPEPDVTNDAHWVQDATIGTVALTAAANFFLNVGNVHAEWVRLKSVVVGDTASVVVWARCEGIEV